MPDPTHPHPADGGTLRWVVTSAFVAVVVGLLAGFLAWVGHGSLAVAVLTGGAASGGTMNLALVLVRTLESARTRSRRRDLAAGPSDDRVRGSNDGG